MLVTKALRQDVVLLAFVPTEQALSLFSVQLKRPDASKLQKCLYDKSTSIRFAVQFQGLDARGHKSK